MSQVSFRILISDDERGTYTEAVCNESMELRIIDDGKGLPVYHDDLKIINAFMEVAERFNRQWNAPSAFG